MQLKLLILSLSMTLAFCAQAAKCQFDVAPKLIEQKGAELHQVWEVKDTPLLWSNTLPKTNTFRTYQKSIQDIIDIDPISILRDGQNFFSQHDNPYYQFESKNFGLVLNEEVGRIRSVNCIESLILSAQVKRYPMATHPTEFSASILRKKINNKSYLRIYFSASDKQYPPVRFDLFENDLKDGSTFYGHLHNHPFRLDQYPSGDYSGATVPSTNDVHLYRAISKRLGLQNGWITNGFNTIHMNASEFNTFYSPDQFSR